MMDKEALAIGGTMKAVACTFDYRDKYRSCFGDGHAAQPE
jgi:hypothetical protein